MSLSLIPVYSSAVSSEKDLLLSGSRIIPRLGSHRKALVGLGGPDTVHFERVWLYRKYAEN